MIKSAISITSFIFIWRSTIVFLIIVVHNFAIVTVTIIAIVDIIRIIIRNIWVMIRCITIIKITTRHIIVVRCITGVMVMEI